MSEIVITEFTKLCVFGTFGFVLGVLLNRV